MARTLPVLVLAAVALSGCVERTIKITSDPGGALVHLNDVEVGRTPVTVPFTFYGVYDVRLEREGYLPLWTSAEAEAPWWEFPGPDLVAEAVPDGKSEVRWHFVMQPQPQDETPEDVLERAREMRGMLRGQIEPTVDQPR